MIEKKTFDVLIDTIPYSITVNKNCIGYNVIACASYTSDYGMHSDIVQAGRIYEGKIYCRTTYSNKSHHAPANEYKQVKEFAKNLLKKLESDSGYFEMI